MATLYATTATSPENTGGAAHNACNLKLRLSPKTTTIPVVFHNLRGYDSHLLMQAISKVEGRVSCIPNNTEKYISFSLDQLRFIDSAQFLLASLDKLLGQTALKRSRSRRDTSQSRRGANCSCEKACTPTSTWALGSALPKPPFPPRGLLQQAVGRAHTKIRLHPRAKGLDDLRLQKNRGLVFETFRKTCMKQYGLDPAHYYTSPGLSCDALLKKTGVELELLTDYYQHLFIEKGLRGAHPWRPLATPRPTTPL
ncbi:hypothetical protein QZH41_000529 [Actinostola sp. cb2023]|nr:hypothetical protein QZH41_000529 [Actinostola sp. cb2023]